MKKRSLVLVSLVGALIGLSVQPPLAWIAPHVMPKVIGENIRYSGTLWNGAVSGIDYLGTVKFKFDPMVWVKGGLPLSFQTLSSAMQISGKASITKIEDLQFTGQLAGLPTTDGRLKELLGEVNIQIAELTFGKDCQSATGQAGTDFLSRNSARWQWQGPVLSGPIICENGDLIANLSGADSQQTLNADLRIEPNGSYRADISVRTPQPEAGLVLPLYGFEKRNGEFRLTEQGKWR